MLTITNNTSATASKHVYVLSNCYLIYWFSHSERYETRCTWLWKQKINSIPCVHLSSFHKLNSIIPCIQTMRNEKYFWCEIVWHGKISRTHYCCCCGCCGRCAPLAKTQFKSNLLYIGGFDVSKSWLFAPKICC